MVKAKTTLNSPSIPKTMKPVVFTNATGPNGIKTWTAGKKGASWTLARIL